MFNDCQNYLITTNILFTTQEKNVVRYLYQPLIGWKASLFYQFLLTEIDFQKNVEPTNLTFDRAYQFLNFSKKDLEEAIHSLIKYRLITFELKKQNCFFVLQQPLSFLEFSQTNLFNQFQSHVNPQNLESIYFLLQKHNNKNIGSTKIINPDSHFDSHLIFFLKKIKCLQNYTLKMEDLNLFQHLHQNMKISFVIIKVILEFCCFKTKIFSKNYLIKVVKTLKNENILDNLEKVQLFFQNLYQTMTVDQVSKLSNQNNFPQWLRKKNSNTIFSEGKLNWDLESKSITEEEFENNF